MLVCVYVCVGVCLWLDLCVGVFVCLCLFECVFASVCDISKSVCVCLKNLKKSNFNKTMRCFFDIS